MNISPKNPSSSFDKLIESAAPLQVLVGKTVDRAIDEWRVLSKLGVSKTDSVKSFTWEGTPVPRAQANRLVRTSDADEDLLASNIAKGKNLIVLMSEGGYRIVKDTRKESFDTEFKYTGFNKISIHPKDVYAPEDESVVWTKHETLFPGSPYECVVTGVVIEHLTLEWYREADIVTLRHDVPWVEGSIFPEVMTEAALAMFMKFGAVGLSLWALDATTNANESILYNGGDYGFVTQDLDQFLLWGLLKLRPNSPKYELMEFIAMGIRFLDPALSEEQSKYHIDNAALQLGYGPWHFLLDTLMNAGMIHDVDHRAKLTNRGVHFYFLLQEARSQS